MLFTGLMEVPKEELGMNWKFGFCSVSDECGENASIVKLLPQHFLNFEQSQIKFSNFMCLRSWRYDFGLSRMA